MVWIVKYAEVIRQTRECLIPRIEWWANENFNNLHKIIGNWIFKNVTSFKQSWLFFFL